MLADKKVYIHTTQKILIISGVSTSSSRGANGRLTRPYHWNSCTNSMARWVADEKLDLNILLRLLYYCSMLQAEVPFTGPHNGSSHIDVPCNRISIFSNSQAVIKSLSNVANNIRIVREFCCYLNLFSKRFRVTLTCVSGHCDIQGNCKTYELSKSGALSSESS